MYWSNREADSVLVAVKQRNDLDGVILVAEDHPEEEGPLAVGEFEFIETFELGSEIGDEGLFVHD